MKTFLIAVLSFAAGIAVMFNLRGQMPTNNSTQIVERVREELRLPNLPIPTPKPDNLLLPDMVPIPPKEVLISGQSGKRFLRFSTTFANIGHGALEFIGHTDSERGKTFASQYIKKTDGTGEYREVGAFVFHPTHRHWHIENWVRYQMWSIKENNQPDKMIADSNKMSFCIWDENSHDLTLPGAPQSRMYSSNCVKNYQGMSVGWSDTYAAKVDGQSLDIGTTPDGTYLLHFEIDPDRTIAEETYDNNAASYLIEIKGNKVTKK